MVHRPPDLIYGLEDDLPLEACLLMGLQHAVVVTISLLMPIMILQSAGTGSLESGSFISSTLLACGVATILQSFTRQGVGSGYLCPTCCEASYIPASLAAVSLGGLPMVSGMTLLSSFFEIVLSKAINRLRMIFTPELIGLVVIMVGVTLIPVASRNFVGLDSSSISINPTAILVAIVTLGIMVVSSIWGKGSWRLFSALIGISSGYVLAYLTGILTPEQVDEVMQMPLISLPVTRMFHISFDERLILPFLIAGLCTSLKAVGSLTLCQKINDPDWVRPEMNSIGGGMLSDGIGSAISGLAGGMGQSISTANVGLALGTGATSRKIAYVVGPALIALSFFPRLTGIFLIMPRPVMGASMIFAVSFSLLTGFQIMMSRMIDSRKIFMIGIAIIFGLSIDTMPEVYALIKDPWITPIISSPLSMATILAISMALLFRIGIAKQHQMIIKPGIDASNAITSFLEVQGATWGARKDVVDRASAALNELMESIAIQSLTEGPVTVDVSFDEFNLDMAVQYRGEMLSIPDICPTQSSLLTDDNAFADLSAFMIRRYSDKITSECSNGLCKVFIHLNH